MSNVNNVETAIRFIRDAASVLLRVAQRFEEVGEVALQGAKGQELAEGIGGVIDDLNDVYKYVEDRVSWEDEEIL